MFNPYVSGAYGVQTFKLDPPGNDRPNFSYSFIRPGAGVRIQATPMVDIEVGAGFLLVNGMGTAANEVKSAAFFPRATATGIDAGLSIGVRFSNLLGVRAGADFRQYGIVSGYQAGDPVVAGGATDRYITAWGGVELLLDGVGGGPAGGGEEEAAPAKKAPAKKAAPPDEPDEEKTRKRVVRVSAASGNCIIAMTALFIRRRRSASLFLALTLVVPLIRGGRGRRDHRSPDRGARDGEGCRRRRPAGARQALQGPARERQGRREGETSGRRCGG